MSEWIAENSRQGGLLGSDGSRTDRDDGDDTKPAGNGDSKTIVHDSTPHVGHSLLWAWDIFRPDCAPMELIWQVYFLIPHAQCGALVLAALH